jgi:hypothetical protein
MLPTSRGHPSENRGQIRANLAICLIFSLKMTHSTPNVVFDTERTEETWWNHGDLSLSSFPLEAMV